MSAAARLWLGRTSHTRLAHFRRSFTHRIAMLEVDVDRLDEAGALASLFKVDRGAAISFRQADHGARQASVPLRLWAEARFIEAGIHLDKGAIRLFAFPRVLGYGFSPISLWFGYGPAGELRGVIYEVHNTFGETHSYVSAFNTDVRAKADKEFYVSPFFDVTGEYRFTLRQPGENMALIVENLSADGRSHVASLNVQPHVLTDRAILRWLIGMPFSGIGVMLAIHWQALRLWLKGAQYRAKLQQRTRRTTLARPEENPAAREDLRKRA
jgi:DUF1365 family protein